jgi:hypothetical protein
MRRRSTRAVFGAIDPERHFAKLDWRTAKSSLDYLVGEREQSGRYVEAQRLGSL